MAGDTSALESRAEKLRALLERDPEDATTWFSLGRALQELARPEDAAGAFERALAIDPGYTAAHRDLGRARIEAGDARGALEPLETAAQLATENGDLQTGNEARVFLRRARRMLGLEREEPAEDGPQAERSLAKSATEGRSPAHPIYREGFDHFANDRFDQAIALFEQAIAIDPNLAIAWNGLSLALRQKGDLEGAVTAGKRLIELEPDDPLSHTNLSILLMRQGKIPEAEDERAEAMQLQMRAQRR
jgi:tetratricopeptide (TPR) repeat protein